MTVLAVMPGKKPVRMELEGSLESMQAFVGGTIQAIYPFDDPVAIVCNEEGKLMGLEYNRALRDETGAIYDILCTIIFAYHISFPNYCSINISVNQAVNILLLTILCMGIAHQNRISTAIATAPSWYGMVLFCANAYLCSGVNTDRKDALDRGAGFKASYGIHHLLLENCETLLVIFRTSV